LNSSLVNKIAKAKHYAERPDRATFHEFKVSFEGDNDKHDVSFNEGAWHCTCDFFGAWQICCHTMAMERILEPMVKVKQSLPELASA
jgi:hypothetical protein